MKQELEETPPCYWSVMRELDRVKHGLTLMGRFEELDVDAVASAAYSGLYTWERSMALLESIWAHVTEAEPFVVPGQPNAVTFLAGFRMVIDQVSEARHVYADNKLRCLNGILVSCGVQYEQEKFALKLESKALTLENTMGWLQQHGWRVEEGMVSLVVAEARVMPETLLLDRDHFQDMHVLFWRVAVNAAVRLGTSPEHRERLKLKTDPVTALM